MRKPHQNNFSDILVFYNPTWSFLVLDLSYISSDFKVRLMWVTSGATGLLREVDLLFIQIHCYCLQLEIENAITWLFLGTALGFWKKYTHSIQCLLFFLNMTHLTFTDLNIVQLDKKQMYSILLIMLRMLWPCWVYSSKPSRVRYFCFCWLWSCWAIGGIRVTCGQWNQAHLSTATS